MSHNIHEHGYWLDKDGHYKDLDLAYTLAVFFGSGTKVLDMGCGEGHYVRAMRLNGVNAIGVDGNPNTPLHNGMCSVADLATPLNLGLFDWVLSLEVGEHIPSQWTDVFVDNLVKHCTEGIVLSWAVPGQGGKGHFNEQPNDWVRKKIEAFGFASDLDSEAILRKYAKADWFKNTIMVFRKVQ